MEKLNSYDNNEEQKDYIEKLKLNYYNFIKNPKGCFGKFDKIVNNHQKEEYVAVFQELIDTSLIKVQCLTEEETDIIRKWLGVTKKEYTSVDKLAKDLGLTYGITERKMKEAYFHIIYRILRGFVDLEEAVLNGDISKEEICNLPIDILDELSSKMYNYISYLDGERIKTIGELINNSIETIQKQRNIGPKTLKTLVDYIHSLGLKFKDENDYEDERQKQIEDWYKIVGFEENMSPNKNLSFSKKSEISQSIRLKLLLERLKKISEQEAIYDNKIKGLVLKKQDLQKSKMEILDEMLTLQSEINSEKETNVIKKVLK